MTTTMTSYEWFPVVAGVPMSFGESFVSRMVQGAGFEPA